MDAITKIINETWTILRRPMRSEMGPANNWIRRWSQGRHQQTNPSQPVLSKTPSPSAEDWANKYSSPAPRLRPAKQGSALLVVWCDQKTRCWKIVHMKQLEPSFWVVHAKTKYLQIRKLAKNDLHKFANLRKNLGNAAGAV